VPVIIGIRSDFEAREAVVKVRRGRMGERIGRMERGKGIRGGIILINEGVRRGMEVICELLKDKKNG